MEHMKRRDLIKMLESHGFRVVRDSGEHTIYRHTGRIVQVPRHREINELTARAILKQAGIQ